MRTLYWRDTAFEASHTLPEHPTPHGHSYWVRLTWAGEPDTHGQLVTEADAAEAVARVRYLLDHKHLNDVLTHPTCERIADFLLTALTQRGVSKVRVWRPTVGDGASAERTAP